jgi:hypothetical protein
MMEGGYIGRCNHEIPKGHCSCCTFDTGLGNWIGLLPDEAPVVAALGTVEEWKQIEVDGRRGIICNRLNAADSRNETMNCTNKPLDCKLYPFWPMGSRLTGFGEFEVELIAGFPKCPLRVVGAIIPDYNGFAQLTSNTCDVHQHLALAAMVGLYLDQRLPEGKLREIGSSYKGYSNTYFVAITEVQYRKYVAQFDILMVA